MSPSKIVSKVNKFWATFVRKFVAKAFHKQPNLVTQVPIAMNRFSGG